MGPRRGGAAQHVSSRGLEASAHHQQLPSWTAPRTNVGHLNLEVPVPWQAGRQGCGWCARVSAHTSGPLRAHVPALRRLPSPRPAPHGPARRRLTLTCPAAASGCLGCCGWSLQRRCQAPRGGRSPQRGTCGAALGRVLGALSGSVWSCLVGMHCLPHRPALVSPPRPSKPPQQAGRSPVAQVQ